MVYDDFGTKVAEDYNLFLMAISGGYHSIVAPGIKVAPNIIREFITKSRKLGKTIIDIIDSDTKEYTEELYGDVFSASDATNAKRQELLHGIKKAVVENLAQLAKLLREGAISNRKVLNTAHGSGSFGLLLQKNLGKIDFKIFDSANRRWNAVQLVRLVARDFAYQAFIDFTIESLRAENHKLARVTYDNPAKTGFVFSLDGKIEDYPTLSEIRKTTFHFNSTARIIPYV